MFQTHAYPAGGRQIDALGDFFRFETCAANGADETIRVRADGNDLGTFLPGDWVRIPVQAKRWEVTPVTGTATGSVRIGVGSVGSSRLTGNVRVIDSGADKTAAAQQFLGSVSTGASASGYALAGIRALSGVIIVKRLQIVSNTAGLVSLYQCTGDTTSNPSNYSPPGLNKLLGSASSANRALRGLSAAANPTGVELPGVAAILSSSCAANAVVEVPMTTPIKLPTGYGLVAQGPAINASVTLLVDWEEAST